MRRRHGRHRHCGAQRCAPRAAGAVRENASKEARSVSGATASHVRARRRNTPTARARVGAARLPGCGGVGRAGTSRIRHAVCARAATLWRWTRAHALRGCQECAPERAQYRVVGGGHVVVLRPFVFSPRPSHEQGSGRMLPDAVAGPIRIAFLGLFSQILVKSRTLCPPPHRTTAARGLRRSRCAVPARPTSAALLRVPASEPRSAPAGCVQVVAGEDLVKPQPKPSQQAVKAKRCSTQRAAMSATC